MWEEYDVEVSTRAMYVLVWICVNYSWIPLRVASDNIVHRDVDDILADYECHMVPKEYRRMSTIN